MTLAATTAGAVKALVESKGLGIAVYRDLPPPTKVGLRPYCTVSDDIAMTIDTRDDGGAAQGGVSMATELVQLDLWMDWRDDKDKSLESKTLADAIHRALDGATLDQAPTRVYGVKVENRIRMVERDDRIVHVAFTLALRRVL